MTLDQEQNQPLQPEATEVARPAQTEVENGDKPKEVGGRKGPEPTRYGDWEKGGRCIDF